MTCCNCTRSPMTGGRSCASSVRTDMEYRVASLCRRRIISRITSFTSTNSRSAVLFLKSRRIRLMISAARVASLTILAAVWRASSMSGCSRESHRTQVFASVTAAAIGCLISWASEAANSLMVVTRFMYARSACAWRKASSARLRSVTSMFVPTTSTSSPLALKTGWPRPWMYLTAPSGSTILNSTA